MSGLTENFLKIGILKNILLQEANYSLVEIREEEVPLYAGPVDTYYYATIAVMLALLVVAFLVTYLVICSKYRKYIRELGNGDGKQLGWRLWKLKETVNELEVQKAESMIREMQESLQKNVKNGEPFLNGVWS